MTGAKFIDISGVRTRYFEKGSGEALVLFHGSHFGTTDACDSAIDWELNFERLAQWFRVIAVDKLGQGHTDNPRSDEDYTMAAVVGHAHRFLLTMGLKNVHVVGHSRGGYLVGRLTLEHPEVVRSCVIVDSGAKTRPIPFRAHRREHPDSRNARHQPSRPLLLPRTT